MLLCPLPLKDGAVRNTLRERVSIVLPRILTYIFRPGREYQQGRHESRFSPEHE